MAQPGTNCINRARYFTSVQLSFLSCLMGTAPPTLKYPSGRVKAPSAGAGRHPVGSVNTSPWPRTLTQLLPPHPPLLPDGEGEAADDRKGQQGGGRMCGGRGSPGSSARSSAHRGRGPTWATPPQPSPLLSRTSLTWKAECACAYTHTHTRIYIHTHPLLILTLGGPPNSGASLVH